MCGCLPAQSPFRETIAGSYINRLENNPTLRPSADRLKALADGLDVPADELLARSVGLVQGDEDAAEVRLLARFRNLSPDRRADVLRIIELWH